MERTTLTAREAAGYLGISYWSLLNLVRRQLIPHSRIGKKFVFRTQTIDQWLTKQENGIPLTTAD